ncbi:hypothetical protein BCR33DRAFT_816753 [Rhizoclosmatium globosum]|uniref:Zn(2)-C6 fungal-type domain-containing protein n=1 Tax=Rhizoclosmatium globosum TaxID=329046 RepID=A0A1Y2CD16_9FUNG|nr:hypothetical protein BCR33DRAFT_816753 [Rhizoclosmatium globosum]|eukprot:ORY44938.1 hypothetical protein BCR33DRAFT_816753 [Rhizoclosmatium globosum]
MNYCTSAGRHRLLLFSAIFKNNWLKREPKHLAEMPAHPTSCDNCRRSKKKCTANIAPDMSYIVCERCVRLEIPCTYDIKTHLLHIAAHANKQSGSSPALMEDGLFSSCIAPLGQEHIPLSQPLEHYLQALSTPFVDYDYENGQLEDPDLIPTAADFQVVHTDLSKRPCALSYDADKLLHKFFSLPPVLRYCVFHLFSFCIITKVHFRLTLCVVSAILSGLQDLSVSYYLRARKALIRAAEQGPTFELAQSYYFLSLFANMKGETIVSRKFLTGCLDLIVELKLDVDPDDSPWLHHLNLTPREKEERRRLFWANYWSLVRAQACSPDPITIELSCHRMKQPSNINDPYPIFASAGARQWDCQVYALIGQIKRYYSAPPASVQDLFSSKHVIALQETLINLQSCIPVEFLLLSASSQTATRDEEDRFINQIITSQGSLFVLTMGFFSAISILHRPLLFLTHLPSHQPQYLSTTHHALIVNAIHQTIEAAHRITGIAFFLASIEETLNNGVWDTRLPKEHYGLFFHQEFFSIFEAAVVYWFATCRMAPVWRVFVDLERGVAVERVRRVMTTLRFMADVVGLTNLEPLAVCVEAMVEEMEGRGVGEEGEREVGFQPKIIGDVGGEDGVGAVYDPWGFMGLLGMQVGGGLRWRGRSEDSWRLFWKLNA